MKIKIVISIYLNLFQFQYYIKATVIFFDHIWYKYNKKKVVDRTTLMYENDTLTDREWVKTVISQYFRRDRDESRYKSSDP